MQDAWDSVVAQLQVAWIQAGAIIVGSILGAYLLAFIINRTLVVAARKTATDVDDEIIDALKQPVFLSSMFYGLSWAVRLHFPDVTRSITYSVLQTLTVLAWAVAALKIGQTLMGALSRKSRYVQPRTLPAFNMLIKIVVMGGAVYFAFIAWDIDLTAWMASAGIIGIAVGFAAKDTLANLFSGIFIIADAPYKVGDFIVVDENLRGRVTRIGMRSTRMLTRDDIEITIPNALIGNSKIVNEVGGPQIHQRVRIYVSAAYGSDVDKVRDVLLECWRGVADVAEYPKPQHRFRAMGESGLDFELLVWCTEPARRGTMISELNTRVYKAFRDAGIEIPYPKRDVYIKELPESLKTPAAE